MSSTTGCPEKLFGHAYMVEDACLQLPYADALHGNPSLAMKPFDEWVPEYRANIRAGSLHDEGNAEIGIGKGRALHGKGLQDAMLQVSRAPGTNWQVPLRKRSSRCTALLLPTNQGMISYGLLAICKPGPGKL